MSDVHGPMDVRPYATPPTVPEEEVKVLVEVRWENGAVVEVPLDDLEAEEGQ